MNVRWCITHSSVEIVPADDPYSTLRCALSNIRESSDACEIVDAEVSWPSP